jgi:hypothetical protein
VEQPIGYYRDKKFVGVFVRFRAASRADRPNRSGYTGGSSGRSAFGTVRPDHPDAQSKTLNQVSVTEQCFCDARHGQKMTGEKQEIKMYQPAN